MGIPENRGINFTLGSNIFYVGLFDYDPIEWPNILQPRLLIKKDNDWELVKAYDVIWKDVQEDIHPNPEDLAISIINNFNKELEKYQEGGELTYNQKLILIFQFRLLFNNNKLSIKPS